MPLSGIKMLENEGLVGLWKIEEQTEPDFLQTDEYLQSITSPVRKQASAAARLLVKRLLEEWNEPYHRIYKNGNGQPFLEKHHFHLSISHAGEYAAAILHKNRKVGIDLEYKKEKIWKVAHRIFSELEMQDIGNQTDKITVYWSVKEVLYKVFGERQLIFKENIFIHPFDLQPETGELTAEISKVNFSEKYKINYQIFPDFVMTWGMSSLQ